MDTDCWTTPAAARYRGSKHHHADAKSSDNVAAAHPRHPFLQRPCHRATHAVLEGTMALSEDGHA